MPTTDEADERLVKTGTYLYAGELQCDVRIVYSPVRYGTGDQADAAEDAEDRVMDSYYVQYGGPLQRSAFISGGGWFPTLAEAVHHVENAVQGVVWQA
jgi:hypothetical protein